MCVDLEEDTEIQNPPSCLCTAEQNEKNPFLTPVFAFLLPQIMRFDCPYYLNLCNYKTCQ